MNKIYKINVFIYCLLLFVGFVTLTKQVIVVMMDKKPNMMLPLWLIEYNDCSCCYDSSGGCCTCYPKNVSSNRIRNSTIR